MNNSKPDIAAPRIYSRNEHPVSRKNIDLDALKIIHRLTQNGYKAFLVGGGVRDLLLHKRPKDFDIATDARPTKVKALFRNCRIIGRRFKLAHVYFAGGKIIEVSTFRDTHELPDLDDVKAKEDLLITQDNVYGNEMTDALRRDLTINALFYDLTTFSIIDYVGGMEDMKAKVARVIGDPEIRFAEDPVRMLRIVRYAAKAGFEIEKTCERAVLRSHGLILKSSQVRVYEELKKDLCSGCASKVLPLLCRCSLLQHLLPALAEDKHILTGKDSIYLRALENADRITVAEGLNSVTPILSLLVLFMTRADLQAGNPLLHFQSADEIETIVNDSFARMSVPRKERERVAKTLGLWFRLLSTPPDKLRPATIVRSEHFEDMLLLLNFVNFALQQTDLIEFLLALRDAQQPARGRPAHSKSERAPRRRGGGRGGRNRGPRGPYPRRDP